MPEWGKVPTMNSILRGGDGECCLRILRGGLCPIKGRAKFRQFIFATSLYRVLYRFSLGVFLLFAFVPRGVWSAPPHFATLVHDGAWTWFNDPRAIWHNGVLYVGTVRVSDGKTVLSAFQPEKGATTMLWESGFSQKDDHNNPGLLVRGDGRLLAVYARHGTDRYFAYRSSTSSSPIQPDDWNAEQTIPLSPAGLTYANPFQLSAENGLIYNFCRNLNFNPTLYTSTDGGASWSAPMAFIRTGAGGTRPYVKYASNSSDRIDALYTDGHPRDVNNSLYHMYYRAGAFFKTDGTLLKPFSGLPIEHDAGERGTPIYTYSASSQNDPNEWIPSGRAWCWEVANDAAGHPVCVFTVQRDGATWADDRIYYYYARWTGSSWQKRFIAHAGRPLYSAEDDYAGGICIDPQQPNVIYISSNALDPFALSDITHVPLRPSNRYELWRGITSDGGLTFSWTAVTQDSTQDNLRPYVPRRYGGEESVIWFQGTYSTYTSYACSVVGLFSSQVFTPPAPPKITYVDATFGPTGNTSLAAGGVFNPDAAASGVDGLWRLRTSFANPLGSGTVVESGGDISTAGQATHGNSENAPRLVTTLSGLTPGRTYRVHAFFWSAVAQSWRIRASLENLPGDLPLFTHISQPNASAHQFSTPPLLSEGDRVLKDAFLGDATADSSGIIRVFIDDDPASRNQISGGANFRSWFDGVGYAPVISTSFADLKHSIHNSSLELSWPIDHTGWHLQINTADLADSSSWITLPGSAETNRLLQTFQPETHRAYFRLVYP